MLACHQACKRYPERTLSFARGQINQHEHIMIAPSRPNAVSMESSTLDDTGSTCNWPLHRRSNSSGKTLGMNDRNKPREGTTVEPIDSTHTNPLLHIPLTVLVGANIGEACYESIQVLPFIKVFYHRIRRIDFTSTTLADPALINVLDKKVADHDGEDK